MTWLQMAFLLRIQNQPETLPGDFTAVPTFSSTCRALWLEMGVPTSCSAWGFGL